MAKEPKSRRVETLVHDAARRRNIPTAELQSFLDAETDAQQFGPVAYSRARPLAEGETRTQEEVSAPELIWNGARIRLTQDQVRLLVETGEVAIFDAQLVWRGKDRQDWSDLIVQAPPLYIQEKIHPKAIIDDLQRATARRAEPEPMADLFADFNGVPPDARTEFYQHDAHWSNRMILGDSLQVMASLAEREALRGKVQCIYFDPPYGIKFNSNWQVSTQSRDVKDGKREDISREPEQVKAFRDTWKDGIHSYLTYLRDRLTVAKELLTESGSIFVQIGDENVHRVRAVMDEVFGEENFCGSITFAKNSGATDELYPDSVRIRRGLAICRWIDSDWRMKRQGFLDDESRRDLMELARDGSAAHRLARRANALVLLDAGKSFAEVAEVLLLDDDTVRTWRRLYEEDGIEGLASFGYEGSACRLNDAQQDKLIAWITESLPRSTREIGAWVEAEFGIGYQSRSGLIALLHRLGMEHRKPDLVSRKLDPEKQAAFIRAYENLLNQLEADEAVLFADAVHPTHAVRPVGCWGPKDIKVAVAPTSGRQRLNIHGALDLETGNTRMLEVATVDAASTIMLLMAIEAMYPNKRIIHLFVDNARYHHAKLVQAWLARPECRIRLRFIPTYCPHLDPIERLWGLMHKQITHNRCYETFTEFRSAILTFLREDVPANWYKFCDAVSDNFRIISPKDFRILA